MDFWDLTKLLFRRWYIAGPLLLLTFAGTAWAALTIKPDYVATSYVQLVPPSVTPKQNDGKAAVPRNPWLDLGVSSLGKAGILTVQDQKVVKVLKNAGFSEDFTLTLDSSLPIVTFEVIGKTKLQASSTTEELVKRFNSSVGTLQVEYGAAKDQSITTKQLDLGDNVTESTSKVKRALVAIGAVGLLLTIAITITIDVVLRRRTADKKAAPGGAEPATGATNGHAVSRFPAVDVVQPVVNGNRNTGVARPRVRPPGEERPPIPGEETAVITIGEDATIAIPKNWRTPSDKGKRR